MKILQVNKFFWMKGGSERYFFDVSRALEEAGHEIIHFSMEDERNEPSPYAEYFIRNIDFTKKRSIGKALHYIYSLEASEMIKRLVMKTRPDVAHLHNIAHQLTPSVIVALRAKNVPIVQTLHDYQLICPNYALYTEGAPCERCKPRKYLNAVKHKCVQDSTSASMLAAAEMAFHNIALNTYSMVDRFICPSKFMYSKMVEWGRPKSRFVHLPHFVEKQRDPSIRKKNQVLYLGRLAPEKGVFVPIEAAEHAPDVEFVFAGEGGARPEMQKQIAEKGLKNCTLVGFKKGNEVDRLIQESRAVVVPSLLYENAPMTIYESFALGTPVIASNYGGPVELVKEHRIGELFEPGNGKDLAKKIKMLFNAGSFEMRDFPYTKEKHLKNLVRIYETAKEKRPPAFD